jgi:hypothetical protein
MMDSLKTCEPHYLHFSSDHFHIVLRIQKHSKHTLLDGFVQCYPKLAHEMGLLPEIAIIRRLELSKHRIVIDSTDTGVETGRPE